MTETPLPSEYKGLPVVGVEKMRELDSRASTQYGIPSAVLMENAGKAVAERLLEICVPALVPGAGQLRVAVCCGKGNNGGDGLVAARYLKEAGADAEVYIIAPKKGRDFGELVSANLKKAGEKGVRINFLEAGLDAMEKFLPSSSVLVDALLGTGSAGRPEGLLRKIIQLMNKSGKPIAAVDIPSGIDPDTGYHSGVFIKARWTLALGLPKKGLLAVHAAANVGELQVLDIGYPEELVRS